MNEDDRTPGIASKDEIAAVFDGLSKEFLDGMKEYAFERTNIALYNYGVPENPYMVHEFVRSIAQAIVAWGIANGYIALTDKGLKKVEGGTEVGPFTVIEGGADS